MIGADFTPFPGFLGGALIGLGSALLALSLGRIAGISGIFTGTLLPNAGDWGWRATFLLGLVLGAGAAIQWVPSAAAFAISPSPTLLLLAGGLVGFGTQLGSGCTSGHGVCGIARFSRRSLVAVPIFIAAGMATVVAMDWLGGL